MKDELDDLLAEYDRNDAPGVGVALTRGGSVIYRRDFGMANMSASFAINRDSFFTLLLYRSSSPRAAFS